MDTCGKVYFGNRLYDLLECKDRSFKLYNWFLMFKPIDDNSTSFREIALSQLVGISDSAHIARIGMNYILRLMFSLHTIVSEWTSKLEFECPFTWNYKVTTRSLTRIRSRACIDVTMVSSLQLY